VCLCVCLCVCVCVCVCVRNAIDLANGITNQNSDNTYPTKSTIVVLTICLAFAEDKQFYQNRKSHIPSTIYFWRSFSAAKQTGSASVYEKLVILKSSNPQYYT